MRDTIKDRDYFKEYIEEEIYYMNDFIKDLEGIELEPEGQETFDSTIDLRLRNILIAKYSMGIDLDELKEDYLKSVSAMEKTWDSESMYVQMAWMISIGILLEVEDEIFDKLVEMEEKDSVNDYVVDYLIAYRKPGRAVSSNVKWPIPYNTIREITLQPKGEAEKMMKVYLEKKWYKGHDDTGWHDNHKSKHDTYFGYWSFESGAIVKIMGLNDSSFKDNQYYPYDMVHYKG